jgi:hypothetical protein
LALGGDDAQEDVSVYDLELRADFWDGSSRGRPVGASSDLVAGSGLHGPSTTHGDVVVVA